MKVLMRRACGSAAVLLALGLWSCGSTDDDEMVLSLIGFDDSGLTQCDTVGPGLAEVDVIQGLCSDSEGEPGTPEPFTETSVNVTFENHQQLDITINSYTVEILGTGVGEVTRQVTQTVTGKRCANEPTRSCALDADCLVGQAIGSCIPSASTVVVLLADFTTKNLIIRDVEPGGKTLDVELRFFGSDVTRAQWQVRGSISARFDNFDNCGCSLAN